MIGANGKADHEPEEGLLKRSPMSASKNGCRYEPHHPLTGPAEPITRLQMMGKLCEQCNQPIYSPEAENEPEALKAIAHRPGEVLRVTWSHCQFTNEYPHLEQAFIVRCRECWEAIAVEEMRQ